MTCQRFFENKFKKMYLNRIKSSFIFPTIQFLIFLFGVSVVPFIALFGNNYGATEDNVTFTYKLKDYMQYIIIGRSAECSDWIVIILYFFVVLTAILTAIVLFNIFVNKKTINVYYSLGLSRSKLLSATLLAGLTLLIAANTVPFVLTYLINGFACGFSKALFVTSLYMILNFCTLSVVVFLIASIAMIVCGSLIEGMFYSFYLNGLSLIFAFAAGTFSSKYLVGGSLFRYDSNDYYGSLLNTCTNIMIGKLSSLNHITRNILSVSKIAALSKETDESALGTVGNYQWSAPSFINLFVWIAVSVALFALTYYLFNRKKAENSGFFGTNKTVYSLLFGGFVLTIASFFASTSSTLLVWLSIVFALVLISISVFILSKTTKITAKNEFKKFPIYVAVPAMFIIVFYSGFFGYSSKIPVAKDISSVKIASSSLYDPHLYQYLENSTNMGNIIQRPYSDMSEQDFTSPEQIKKITEIHSNLIESAHSKTNENYSKTAIKSYVMFEYTLKNGKKFYREYSIATPEITVDILNLKSNSVSNSPLGNVEDILYPDIYNKETDNVKRFTTIYSGDLSRGKNVNLSDTQIIDFVKAYEKDFQKLDISQIMMPGNQNLGIIRFCVDDLINYDDESSKLKISDISEKMFTSESISFNTSRIIPISKDMTNVINWAKGCGIYKYFEADNTIKYTKISVIDTSSVGFKQSMLSANSDYYSLQIFGSKYNSDVPNMICINKEFGTDVTEKLSPKEIEYIRQNSYSAYVIAEGGYFVRLSTEGEITESVELFIPSSKLTKSIINKLK